MSDGPHRSLPMRRRWKALAERADNPNYEPAQICDAVCDALEEDFREEVPQAFLAAVRTVLGDTRQQPLFSEIKVAELAALKRSASGHPLAAIVIDCTIQSVASATPSAEPLLEGVTNALLTRAPHGTRQIEEHYLRKSNAPRAQNVRSRIEGSISHASCEVLARRLLGIDPSPRQPSRKDGLEDGVRI